jgi:hypothetical protein
VVLGVAVIARYLWHSRLSLAYFSVEAAIAASIAIWLLIAVNSQSYATIFAPEAAILGRLRMDTLFHASIASMIRGFGVASTGLDGVPPTPYHILSHAWLGLTSKAADIDTITGYALGHQIVLLPAMYFTVSRTALHLRIDPSSPSGSLWLATVAVALSMILSNWDFSSYLVSESYALGILLVLQPIILLTRLSRDLSSEKLFWNLCFCTVLATLAASAKVSTALPSYVGIAYLALRSGTIPLSRLFALALLGGASIILLQFYILPVGHVSSSAGIDPLHFYRSFKVMANANLILIGCASFICVAAWKRRQNCALQEMLLAMMLACVVASMLVRLDAGNAYYILNIATWIAIAVLSAFAAEKLPQARSLVLLTCCAAFVACAAAINIYNGKQIEKLSNMVFALAKPENSLGGYLFDGDLLNQIANRADQSDLAILKANLLSASAGTSKPIVYLRKPVAQMSGYTCKAAPFFIPAAVGLPILGGLPPEECKAGIDYGYINYLKPSVLPAYPAVASDRAICMAVIEKNFRHVLVVEDTAQIRALDCSISR